MELHQLRYFLAVARTGNFSRAAEQCHVSQPSLSQQIAKLEDELGVRLFDRNKRHSSLTPHGEALLPRATRILDEVDTASREARDATELLRGKIRLGVLPTIAPYLLPDVIKNFARNYPGLEIVLDEDTTGQLLEKLLACDIDFALTSLPLGDPRFQTHHLFDEDLLLALPADHPLSRKKAIHTRDLRNERLIVMKDGHCLGDQVLGFCERQEVPSEISLRSAQLETTQALVRVGAGLSLIPAMATRQARPGLSYRPFSKPRPSRAIVVAWSKQRPPGRAASAFLKVLIEELQPRS